MRPLVIALTVSGIDGGNYPCHEEPILQPGASGFASGIALEQLGAFGVAPKPNGENVTEDGNAQHRAGENAGEVEVWVR